MLKKNYSYNFAINNVLKTWYKRKKLINVSTFK